MHNKYHQSCETIFGKYTIIGMIHNIAPKSLEGDLVQIVGRRLVTR